MGEDASHLRSRRESARESAPAGTLGGSERKALVRAIWRCRARGTALRACMRARVSTYEGTAQTPHLWHGRIGPSS